MAVWCPKSKGRNGTNQLLIFQEDKFVFQNKKISVKGNTSQTPLPNNMGSFIITSNDGGFVPGSMMKLK